MSRIALAAFAGIVLAGAALAQAPAAAPGAAPAASASTCAKPGAHPGRLSSDRQRQGWDKEVRAWQDCQKKYVAEIQAKADEAVKTANAAVAQSNAAVADYNDTVKAIQAQLEALK